MAAVAGALDDATHRSREAIRASHLEANRPQDLVVCCLCGPEPGKDFEVFAALGVLPQNIWAFKSDKATCETAIQAVGESWFP